MFKTDLGRKLAALLCTAVFSSVFVLSAVAPAGAVDPLTVHAVA